MSPEIPSGAKQEDPLDSKTGEPRLPLFPDLNKAADAVVPPEAPKEKDKAAQQKGFLSGMSRRGEIVQTDDETMPWSAVGAAEGGDLLARAKGEMEAALAEKPPVPETPADIQELMKKREAAQKELDELVKSEQGKAPGTYAKEIKRALDTVNQLSGEIERAWNEKAKVAEKSATGISADGGASKELPAASQAEDYAGLSPEQLQERLNRVRRRLENTTVGIGTAPKGMEHLFEKMRVVRASWERERATLEAELKKRGIASQAPVAAAPAAPAIPPAPSVPDASVSSSDAMVHVPKEVEIITAEPVTPDDSVPRPEPVIIDVTAEEVPQPALEAHPADEPPAPEGPQTEEEKYGRRLDEVVRTLMRLQEQTTRSGEPYDYEAQIKNIEERIRQAESGPRARPEDKKFLAKVLDFLKGVFTLRFLRPRAIDPIATNPVEVDQQLRDLITSGRKLTEAHLLLEGAKYVDLPERTVWQGAGYGPQGEPLGEYVHVPNTDATSGGRLEVTEDQWNAAHKEYADAKNASHMTAAESTARYEARTAGRPADAQPAEGVPVEGAPDAGPRRPEPVVVDVPREDGTPNPDTVRPRETPAPQPAERPTSARSRVDERAQERGERDRYPVFSRENLSKLKRDAERAEAEHKRWEKVAKESGLNESDVADYKWIADQKWKTYEDALKINREHKVAHVGEGIIRERRDQPKIVFSDDALRQIREEAVKAREEYELQLRLAHEAGMNETDISPVYKKLAEMKQEMFREAMAVMHPEQAPIGRQNAAELQDAYEKNRNSSKVWGWTKERLKGLASFGLWDFYQGKKFGKARREVGRKTGQEATLVLHQLEKLDVNEAWLEAEQLKARSGPVQKASEYEKVSRLITYEKTAENEKHIKRLLDQAEGELVKKLGGFKIKGKNFWYYRSNSGEKILAKDKLDDLRDELEVKLRSYQNGEVAREWRDMRKIIMKELDPNYLMHYVYGGLEALIMIGGVVFVAPKILGLGAKAAVESGAAQAVGEVAMKDTIWNTSRILLEQAGMGAPTDGQIMEVSKAIAEANNIGVQEWGLSGSPMDTAMQQGHLLKLGQAAGIIARLVAGI
ncbi:MAG: hypothetical protein A3I44_01440 [Candidatus Sungbacteria bacterium RIFCSPLOWO2_02_FULL_51_17]|uniref:Uncharacterized protein n=1 Tax=Candidatus Sungbacteria bacterium RIFCSPHIGHO2_02_FULL_51_29 TaxID=1802273 RepID=A0A1G2KVM7_9BACT|nr:MAG: hypothetical protein A2676_05650 [Candidatus Sungbacteria bacterium RIFCSPHIGHO2_01_FULL_51_22]OHA03234.1 MAG: hypothetical protein A3C16_01610 [Candidatus Sungbacteria bacterium RIFCSPHIGHO2_02_FULL_51_29]OHA08027.1 MAG: hypothetical protein A3B29_03705 [Candidatus Sungbacteria bacterium RIFCSPLOWO2_01_FULL_51_34]OHA10869.1 MAG: hypothetical protein A3I44_01440 [Candidatus Sungbacteria bacterium RIFCSPLOWO2_02_FULL_51_17]